MTVTLGATEPHPWLELQLPSAPGGTEPFETRIMALDAGEHRSLEHTIPCDRWGIFDVGRTRLDEWCGQQTHEVASHDPLIVRVYPRLETLRSLVVPRSTRPTSGNRRSRGVGEGIEFAELRGFQTGDRLRRINWPATLRRGELLVNERHPEESSDVVIFLDALIPERGNARPVLDEAVRAVATIAAAYLAKRDRVGLLTFGRDLDWIRPADGNRALYQLVEAAMSAEATRFHRWLDPRLIPRQALPPKAMVVALTPFLDYRVIRALLDLRSRGWDLTVIEVDPSRHLQIERDAHPPEAWRIWQLERLLTRRQFEQSGCRIARWDGSRPLSAVLEELAWSR